jgi:hypothetical protein
MSFLIANKEKCSRNNNGQSTISIIVHCFYLLHHLKEMIFIVMS